jgi:hypothetical protein
MSDQMQRARVVAIEAMANACNQSSDAERLHSQTSRWPTAPDPKDVALNKAACEAYDLSVLAIDQLIEAARRDGAMDLYRRVVEKARAACSHCEPVRTYTVAEAFDELFPPDANHDVRPAEGR